MVFLSTLRSGRFIRFKWTSMEMGVVRLRRFQCRFIDDYHEFELTGWGHRDMDPVPLIGNAKHWIRFYDVHTLISLSASLSLHLQIPHLIRRRTPPPHCPLPRVRS